MSTVAGAVVTIDGDSSGLVGALQKGEKGIADVKQESRKLSDQLKEVADDADKAAGALVQKIGGPTAIKAIAGIGVAVGAAKELVGAFMESSEKLFQSYGDEGKRVWEQTEKGLFAVKGAFAEALLGGRDLNENAERMNTLLAVTKAAADLLLSPLKLLADAMWSLSNNTKDQTTYQRDLLEIEQKYNIAVGQTTTALQQSNIAYEAMTVNLGNLLRSKQEDAAISLQASLDRIEMFRAEAREAKEFRANADADAQAALVRADLLQSGLASKLDAAEHELTVINDGVRQSQEEINARAREMLLADVTFQKNLYQNQEAARTQAYEKSAKQTEAEKTREQELLTQRENLIQRYEELRTFGAGGVALPPTPKPTTLGTPVTDAANDVVYALQLTGGGYAELTEQQYTAFEEAARVTGDYSARIVEMRRSEFDQIEDAAVKLAMVEADLAAAREEERQKEAALRQESYAKALAELEAFQEAERERVAKAADGRLEIEKTTKQQMFDLAVTGNAKMLGAAIAANKSMAEVARAAIGNVVSALGDKAMVEAGAYAAEGNFGQATAMAAVGTTMYTVAAALGAQKKPNAGPPTERQQPVQNYAYNLRIDAAFADSESISRRFAQMQEGARARGLIAGAA